MSHFVVDLVEVKGGAVELGAEASSIMQQTSFIQKLCGKR